MEVYVLCFSASVVGVYSSKEKLFASYLSKNIKYKDEIISDCFSSKKYYKKFDEETKEEVSKFFKGEEFDIDKISLKDLTELTNVDYHITIKKLDK